MNHWPFIIAAYGIVILGTAIVLIQSYAAMRRAERKADQLSAKR